MIYREFHRHCATLRFTIQCTLIEQTVNIIQSRQFAIIQNSAMLSLYQAVLPIFIKYACMKAVGYLVTVGEI